MNYRLLAVCLVALAVAHAAEDQEFQTGDHKVRFLGQAPKFVIEGANRNASFLRVDFGAIFEADSDGKKVPGRQIMSLAALEPEFTTGTDTIDAKNVSFVKMHLPFANITGLNYSACDSAVTAEEFADGHFSITVFFGITEDTVFPYGFNNDVVAPANSTKFSIDAKHWPFCNDSNTLQVELDTRTGAGNKAKPRVSNSTDSDEDDEPTSSNSTSTSNTTESNQGSPSRKLLAKGQPDEGQHGNGKLNGPGPGGPHPHPHPRDPRVAGARKDKLALLTGVDNEAALINLETYAYDSMNGTQVFNITSDIQEKGEHMVITLGFPAFTSLFYDPTATLVDASAAGYSEAELISAPGTPGSASGSVRAGAMSAIAAVLLLAVLV